MGAGICAGTIKNANRLLCGQNRVKLLANVPRLQNSARFMQMVTPLLTFAWLLQVQHISMSHTTCDTTLHPGIAIAPKQN
jgi:hypothetical protein